MSKSDEMRRMREQLAANRERSAGTVERPTPPAAVVNPRAADEDPAAPQELRTERHGGRGGSTAERTAVASEQGKCAVCGKLRPLTGGLIGVHQKGLGKVCAGSRKEPA